MQVVLLRLAVWLSVGLVALADVAGAASRSGHEHEGVSVEWRGDLDDDGKPDRLELCGHQARGHLVFDFPKLTLFLGEKEAPSFQVDQPGGSILCSDLESDLAKCEHRTKPLVGPISIGDVNGNGRTNLVFRVWSGGNNEGTETVLELSQGNVKPIFYGYGSRFTDLDRDRVFEIVGPIAMSWRAMCPVPTGIWAWDGGQYVVANRTFRAYFERRLRKQQARRETGAQIICTLLSLGRWQDAKEHAERLRESLDNPRDPRRHDIGSIFRKARNVLGSHWAFPAE